ncbi:hypothetical protein [Leekyejoonella antrihumi]|uniref:Aspartyl protease n=1 Tax=Leekyejoonella antrihumi TaxID=1660198 RepID=A0A563E3J7_9MICO|nr:hypothetical protein [Leekyejoonella antrihumi]TWP36985.1 hypothetical protein FGL98_07980 [Leekyejoonella antrihumi]
MAMLYLPKPTSARRTPVGVSSVMRLVADSGTRPIVTAHVGGLEVSMQVHSNAGFDAMLTHDAVRRLTGRSVVKEQEFGLADDLSLSTAGRGRTRVDSLVVAGVALTDLEVEVFDLPTDQCEGLLGVGWLRRVGAVIDFGTNRLIVPEDAAQRDAMLLPLVGRALPLQWDAVAARYVARVEIGGVAGRFVLSTVAGLTLDLAFARASGAQLAGPVGEEHGPTGAVIPLHRTVEPVVLQSGGGPLPPTPAQVYDLYAYMGAERPTDGALDGHLGADVLIACGAVVDFGD